MHFVFYPRAVVLVAIRPCVLASSFLDAILEGTYVSSLVRKNFFSNSVLLVLVPFTNVSWPIFVEVWAKAMWHVVFPLPFVDIAIWKVVPTSTRELIFFPITLVLATIFPDLNSVAMFHFTLKLTSICNSFARMSLMKFKPRVWY